jgi:RecQ family ATP-dependent DNA helicase
MVDFRFEENLKNFWKSNTFREIKIYSEPIESNKTKIITQKDILDKIASNINLALKCSDVRDLFITASTGLGKSLLFQLPAIDLHQNGLIVIVITPLKALMKDQVDSLKNKEIGFATYLNSDDTYLEREEKLKGIKEGKYSLIYVSPEFLVRHKNLTAMFNLKGERKIGLYVIDEAHCVSTWGKGFRPDYWFLGKRLRDWRKVKECNAPIVALTATAVNDGDFDSVSEITKKLNLNKEEVLLSYIKRDNIEIGISKLDESLSKSKKKSFVIKKISELREKNKKILIYHPYKSGARLLSRELRVKPFVGDMDKEEREEVLNKFRDGELDCVVATKAFGMGIDIKDIDCVYHYAINKSLTEYMQEIGRAGREKEITAYALTDFQLKDLKYTEILIELSRISQCQIKKILRKIINIYKESHQSEKYKSVLIYSDTFFNIVGGDRNEDDVEKKLERALLFIEEDLFEKFHSYILSFDIPETTEVFCYIIYDEIFKLQEDANLSKCFELLRNSTRGNIYKLNLEELWRLCSKDESFGFLKSEFYKGRLLLKGIKIEPRIEIKANLKLSFKEASSKLEDRLKTIKEVLLGFSDSEFEEKDFIDGFEKSELPDSIAKVILSFFSFEENENSQDTQNYKFIIRKHNYYSHYKYKYNITQEADITQEVDKFHDFIKDGFSELFSEKQQSFHQFSTLDSIERKKLILGFLELFDLADFQITGSENPAFEIYISDPVKIENLLNQNYFNQELNKSQRREREELSLIKKFCSEYKNSDQAWEFLENYFLGRFEYPNETTNSYSEEKNQVDSFSASSSSAIPTSDKASCLSKGYSVGEKIFHKTLGYGTINKFHPDRSADIRFNPGGKNKRIDLNIAPIEKLPPTIEPGTLVEVEDLDTKEKISYCITEPNPLPSEIDTETRTISPESPVGKALIDRKKGDIVRISVNAGKIKRYKITDFCEYKEKEKGNTKDTSYP